MSLCPAAMSAVSPLESDYCRIEIQGRLPGRIPLAELESDYCRIEMTTAIFSGAGVCAS